MKAKKCLVLLVLILLFTGCEQQDAGRLHTFEIPEWELFEGEPMLTDIAIAELNDITVDDDNTICFRDTRFCEYNVPEGNNHVTLSFGWRIDVGKLIPVGKTLSGEIVLSSDIAKPPVLCLVSTTSNQLRLFLCADLHDDLNNSLNLDTFTPYVTGQQFSEEKISHILRIHLGIDSHEKGVPFLDGEWEYSTIRLVHKDCEALQYLINIDICAGYVYVLDSGNNVKMCNHY